ncbi:unnamed protein product [Vicia faba]|uniref:Poly(A) RNA polymerase mitochondrial-like central palm domain-containing protein n=1 Tax=Vicia faba TaxID=3906 RepID=A0AAV0YUZ0_VICFA|nr:unnamed protein product [Vicia faba]
MLRKHLTKSYHLHHITYKNLKKLSPPLKLLDIILSQSPQPSSVNKNPNSIPNFKPSSLFHSSSTSFVSLEVEPENLQIPETILYTTLTPLPLAAHEYLDSDNHGQYYVFHNKISLDTPQVKSVHSTAQDFFSLDVAEEAEDKDTLLEPKTPALGPDPTLKCGWFRGNYEFRSSVLQVHKEIVDFCEFSSPTLEEKMKRDSTIESEFEVINHIWPHCQVEVFGSFRTVLYLSISDIDVVILKSGLVILFPSCDIVFERMGFLNNRFLLVQSIQSLYQSRCCHLNQLTICLMKWRNETLPDSSLQRCCASSP